MLVQLIHRNRKSVLECDSHVSLSVREVFEICNRGLHLIQFKY